MPVEKPLRDQIDEVMVYFNFGKVRRIMRYLGYCWVRRKENGQETDSFPTESEMRLKALEMLKELAGTDKHCDSRNYEGFVATKKDGVLKLSFEVEQWNGDNVAVKHYLK